MLFFHRHPRTLLTNDCLSVFVGYDREQIAHSLDGLIAGGLLKQIRGQSNTVNLYVLEREDPSDETVKRLLEFALKRDGRACVMRLLAAVSGRSHRNGVPRGASLVS